MQTGDINMVKEAQKKPVAQPGQAQDNPFKGEGEQPPANPMEQNRFKSSKMKYIKNKRIINNNDKGYKFGEKLRLKKIKDRLKNKLNEKINLNMKSISDNKLQINDQYKDINRYKLNKY